MKDFWGNILHAMVYCCWAFFAQASHAAEIKVLPDELQGFTVITINGELEFGDEQRFENKALQIEKAIVFFDSPGGELRAGLGIGKAIRLRNFITAIANGVDCASACGLAWLGGKERLVFMPGQVGFHAAYRKDRGRPEESGAGNAIVGAYLNQLGLTNSAIEFLTEAPPESMQWLTPEFAKLLGIAVEFIPEEQKSEAKIAENSVVVEESYEAPQDSGFIQIPDRDIYGFDLGKPLTLGTTESCQMQCSKTTGCKAYSYLPATDTCFLKSGGDRVWWSKGVMSGYASKLQSRLRMTKMAIHPSTELDGREFSHTLNSKTEDCVSLCEADTRCTGFTFSRKLDGRCSLKTGQLKRKSQKAIIAGIKTKE